MLRIDFLYWRECPSHSKAWQRLHKVLGAMGLRADVHRIEVKTEAEADRYQFPGSPTLRINGRDMDSAGAREQPFGLTCRIYHDPAGRVIPLPTEDLIREAIGKESRKAGIV